jgi:Zn-dependent protease/predicted transcriptional regulator
MFSNAIQLFSINGFKIRLDPSWFIIAALVIWSLSQQYFPSILPGASQTTYFIMSLVAMLCFFASLLLHELAHSVVARSFGVEIKNITLFIFGGVAELESEPQSATAEFTIALAGPAMSLSLAFGFWVLAQVSSIAYPAEAPTLVLSYLALLNLILAIFNLVPAFPMDGGRVLRAYLWHRSGDILSATETAAKSGRTFAYLLMAFGLWSLFQGAVVTGLWQLMIGGFVLMAARSSYQTQLARLAFDHKSVRDLMTENPITVGPEVTLSEFVNKIMLQSGVSFVPVVDAGMLLGHMGPAVLSAIDRENWGSIRVGDVFSGLDDASAVAPDVSVQDLIALIGKTGRRKFMVVDDHKLLGVISLSDLSHYLQVFEFARHHSRRYPG